MVESDFPFIEIPAHLQPMLGLPDEGTRIYRAYGPRDAFGEWWEAVCEACGEQGSVSPGGVCMHVKVSRAGVYKRMKEGRLTALCFHVEEQYRTIFRKREMIKTSGHPYCCVPVTECVAWSEQLRHLEYRERKLIQWGDGDHAGQVLIRNESRPAERSRKK
jgi:hypothetical protein